jgi:hypothetical protein
MNIVRRRSTPSSAIRVSNNSFYSPGFHTASVAVPRRSAPSLGSGRCASNLSTRREIRARSLGATICRKGWSQDVEKILKFLTSWGLSTYAACTGASAVALHSSKGKNNLIFFAYGNSWLRYGGHGNTEGR